MGIISLGLAVPDLQIPRGYPCGAIVNEHHEECGATPASLYLRVCGVVGHERRIWLCPVHAALAAGGGAICQECAKAGGVVPVVLFRLSEPVRIPL